LKWVVSPKGLPMGRENSFNFQGFRCIGSCFNYVHVPKKPTETFERLWSDKNNWPNQTLPKEDEDVEIEPGWNMIMDLPVTPKFKVIQINGILNFKKDIDIHLKAEHIFVRAGELIIGS
jgi:hypothetical protein